MLRIDYHKPYSKTQGSWNYMETSLDIEFRYQVFNFGKFIVRIFIKRCIWCTSKPITSAVQHLRRAAKHLSRQ